MKKLLALALSLALLCAMAPLAIADEPITVTVIGPSSATTLLMKATSWCRIGSWRTPAC